MTARATVALISKDLMIQKANVILGALYSLIFFGGLGLVRSAPEGGFTYVFSGIAVGYMLALGSFAADKNDTPRFVLSLPITRRQVVNGKFILLGLATIYGTLAAMIVGAVMAIPAIGAAERWINGLDLLRITAGMLLPTFLIPLYFRFGHLLIKYALFVVIGALVALQVAGMVVFTLTDASGGMFVVFDWIYNIVRRSDPLRLNLVLIAIGAVTAVASYIASRAIYAKRDI